MPRANAALAPVSLSCCPGPRPPKTTAPAILRRFDSRTSAARVQSVAKCGCEAARQPSRGPCVLLTAQGALYSSAMSRATAAHSTDANALRRAHSHGMAAARVLRENGDYRAGAAHSPRALADGLASAHYVEPRARTHSLTNSHTRVHARAHALTRTHARTHSHDAPARTRTQA